MATVTNRKASQSLQGQSVLVTLDVSDAASLSSLSEGQLVTNDSSGNKGTIERVDYFGNSFRVTPVQPNTTFESAGTYGYLAVNETITV